jgi:vitamin-K-epoxide reductase (warfarin-sensitive)
VGPLLGADHPLNLPNSIFGLAVYAVFFLFGAGVVRVKWRIVDASFRGAAGSAWAAGPLRLLAVACVLGSVYLGYILSVVLQDVCVVCVSTYVVNAGLLVATVRRGGSAKAKAQ